MRNHWHGSHLRLFAKRMLRKCKKLFSPPFPRTKVPLFPENARWRTHANTHSRLSYSLFVLAYSRQITISVNPAFLNPRSGDLTLPSIWLAILKTLERSDFNKNYCIILWHCHCPLLLNCRHLNRILGDVQFSFYEDKKRGEQSEKKTIISIIAD